MTHHDQSPTPEEPATLAITPASDNGSPESAKDLRARVRQLYGGARPGAGKALGAVSLLVPLLADVLGRYLNDEKKLAATKKQLVSYLVDKRGMKRNSAESAVDGALKVAKAVHARSQRKSGK